MCILTEVYSVTSVPMFFFEMLEKSYIGRVKTIARPQVFLLHIRLKRSTFYGIINDR
jgi:hypothetical protein